MVNTVEITKTEFLLKYARGSLTEPVGPIAMNGETRIYGRTSEGQAGNPDGYIIIYAVI